MYLIKFLLIIAIIIVIIIIVNIFQFQKHFFNNLTYKYIQIIVDINYHECVNRHTVKLEY